MKDISAIRKRYISESIDKRLGHLASDLARISSFLQNVLNKKVVADILEESKYFIEWTAKDVPFDTQIFLLEIQLKLALWHLRLWYGISKSGTTENCTLKLLPEAKCPKGAIFLFENKESDEELKKIRQSTMDWSRRLLSISGLLTA